MCIGHVLLTCTLQHHVVQPRYAKGRKGAQVASPGASDTCIQARQVHAVSGCAVGAENAVLWL